MRQEAVYDVVKDECRKQFILGGVKGVSASQVAEKLNMHRSNVAREFKKLLDMKLLYKREGRPVLYYVDSSVIEFDLKTHKDMGSLLNNIDGFIERKTEVLANKGFREDEIKNKLIYEVEGYIDKYFQIASSRNEMQNIVKELIGVEYVIGVDGGGTKTEAIAYNLQGEEIGRGYSGFGNIVVDREEGLKNIEIAILKCMKNLDETKCVHIYAGLAGAETGNNKGVIKSYLSERFPVSITVVSDADLAINALLKGEDGILTISGTGSISYGKYKGKMVRAGGWGNILGDEGSGYHIAIEALRKMVKDKDTGLEISNLSKALLNELNMDSIKDAVKFVYGSNKGEIAALVPVIVDEAMKGESSAIEILEQAGKDLAEITFKVYKLLEIEGEAKLAVKGSIITKISIVKDSFVKTMKSYIEKFTIIDDEVSSAEGAYYMAVKDLSIK
ncbi:ROK family transcriptional regulator [Clostridium sp. MSJ-4]|uniref:ROK family transcriptional regulator n=1 Tax=Clostridium simiarum TaxID=2841506 RepID=A0ABS6F2R2_9CLOT|nr:ROK family transcriptional regulator [Clostridium simiarum]